MTPTGAIIRRSLVAVAIVSLSTGWCHRPAETPFAVENRVAMARMMTAMHAAASGDVDQDFSTMMIAHHQGAIDMAQAELRHGRNEQLRRIAQGIVVQQQQEIEAMRLAVSPGSNDGGPRR